MSHAVHSQVNLFQPQVMLCCQCPDLSSCLLIILIAMWHATTLLQVFSPCRLGQHFESKYRPSCGLALYKGERRDMFPSFKAGLVTAPFCKSLSFSPPGWQLLFPPVGYKPTLVTLSSHGLLGFSKITRCLFVCLLVCFFTIFAINHLTR